MSDERQLLLRSTDDPDEDVCPPTESHFSSLRQQSITPLPVEQITILFLIQLSEHILSTVIYPFIAQLVNETGITGGDESKIGYYVGLMESVFCLMESIFALQYGRISDRIGRRPVLMFGLFGQTFSIFSIGLSKRFWHLVFSRASSGALNGNLGVSKSTIVELTDETNQAQAFSFLAILWSIGSTIGPFIGGTFSNPTKLFPRLFDTPFWNEYPYFLPCLMAATYSSCMFIITGLFLKETHNTQSEYAASGNAEAEYGTTPSHTPSVETFGINPIGPHEAAIAYFGLVPVVFAVSVKNDGLGFSPRTIGLILGLQGIITGVFQVFFFAPLHRRFGTKRLYVAGYLSYSALILSLPIMHGLVVLGMRRAVWVVMGLHIAISCVAYMSFGCMAIFVNNSAPSKDALGTLNGISQTTISITKMIGRVTATSLFSLSVERNILGGNLVYAFFVSIGCLGIYGSQWLEEAGRAYE
ncbi:hypothetical protein OPQ81_010384 [Rhizoctonia solani]|nr:hypothetical protein OPQ81_010384 [Rhizoctonia solani]